MAADLKRGLDDLRHDFQEAQQRNDEQFAALHTRIDRVESGLGARIDRVETGLSGLGARIDRVETGLSGLGARIDRVEIGLSGLGALIEHTVIPQIQQLAESVVALRDHIDHRFAEYHEKLMNEHIGPLEAAARQTAARLDRLEQERP